MISKHSWIDGYKGKRYLNFGKQYEVEAAYMDGEGTIWLHWTDKGFAPLHHCALIEDKDGMDATR